MNAMLDTNICIYIIKQRPAQVLEKLLATRANDVGVSVITVAELTVPYSLNASRRSSEVVAKAKFPTYSFLVIAVA